MATNNWRTKSLPLAEWVVLQNAFEELQITTGAPADLAMFLKSRPSDAEAAIYITGQGIEVIEALSPGGWQYTSAPSGDGVALLVGAGDAWDLFGIAKP